MKNIFSKLSLGNNHYIAYQYTPPEINKLTYIYLCGYMSDMYGTKVMEIERYCLSKGSGFIKFDYLGHGQSSGDIADFSFTDWLNNAIEIIRSINPNNLVIIGSSFGGWLMLLIAQKLDIDIKALIGIASAPDFSKDLEKELSAEQKTILKDQGKLTLENGLIFSQKFITDSKNYYLLDSDIAINYPIYLLHGMQDSEVDYNISLNIAKIVHSQDVTIQLFKEGDHRLSGQKYIDCYLHIIDQIDNNNV